MAAAEPTRSAALGVLDQIAKVDNENIAASWEKQLDLTPAGPHRDEPVICEDRMQVHTRDPDRARAVGSVFGSIASLESTPEGKRLIQWASLQLIQLHSPSAGAELERIAGDLAVQTKNFPEDSELAQTKTFIDAVLAARRK